MLLDVIRPTRGTSRILGGSGRDPAVRARVGYLPGDLNLPRAMTGEDAIAYFGGLRRESWHQYASVLVDRFGLDPRRPVRELGTGNRRKVGLVLAFMGHPELLILDEPTSGLADPSDPLTPKKGKKNQRIRGRARASDARAAGADPGPAAGRKSCSRDSPRSDPGAGDRT
jgi:ABC-type uncharacterized transport system ATPase subunit